LASAVIAIWLAGRPPNPTPHVTAIAFSPDGQFLAGGDRQGRIVIWRMDSLQPVRHLYLKGGGLNTLAFSPDSRRLAAAGRPLQLWSTVNWNEIGVLGAAGNVFGAGRFGPDGVLLASVNDREQIEVWDTEKGTRLRTICCMALYGDVAFSPDGGVLAAGGHWPSLWDLRTGRRIRRLVETREPTFGPVCFRPDGRVLATGSQDGKARLWDVDTGREILSSKPRRAYVESVGFHPDGKLLAYALRDGGVWLWDTGSGSEREITTAATSNVSFSPDGRWLGFGLAGGMVQLWDLATAQNGPVLLPSPD